MKVRRNKTTKGFAHNVFPNRQNYVQVDEDEDDNFGKTGRVARKKKAARQAERRHLAGDEARRLYLECLQLLLRKQVLWLVRHKGFHPELEAVCRDLWLLRVRGFPGLADGKKEALTGEAAERAARRSDSSAGPEMFSSLSSASEGSRDSEGDESGGGWGSRKKRKSRSWTGEVWALPGAMDTLGLVYLGCLLRQEPVRIGDVFWWARNNQLPFLGAVSSTALLYWPSRRTSAVLTALVD